jgi:hypothetical protein
MHLYDEDFQKITIREDSDIHDNGYAWDNMIKISPAEALSRIENNEEVFILYDDNTEGVIEDIAQIKVGGSYGIEK